MTKRSDYVLITHTVYDSTAKYTQCLSAADLSEIFQRAAMLDIRESIEKDIVKERVRKVKMLACMKINCWMKLYLQREKKRGPVSNYSR